MKKMYSEPGYIVFIIWLYFTTHILDHTHIFIFSRIEVINLYLTEPLLPASSSEDFRIHGEPLLSGPLGLYPLPIIIQLYGFITLQYYP